MKIGKREFDTGSGCYVMGILNVTPDSFSDGGRHASLGAAVGHALRMLGEGADIIDIGGESTRPGYAPVDAAEEMRRVVPVVEALRAVSGAPISVDTTKAAVAEAALAAGADIINDVSALRADPRMAAVIAAHGAACCLMHSESAPEGGGFMPAMKESLLRSVDAALTAGVRPDGTPAWASPKTTRRTSPPSTGWASCARWAIPCCWASRASPSSGARWACRWTGGWRAR